MILLLFIFVLSIFLGFELIAKVPSQLHTPLMSGSNAISGITMVGRFNRGGNGRRRGCHHSSESSPLFLPRLTWSAAIS